MCFYGEDPGERADPDSLTTLLNNMALLVNYALTKDCIIPIKLAGGVVHVPKK